MKVYRRRGRLGAREIVSTYEAWKDLDFFEGDWSEPLSKRLERLLKLS